MNFYHKITNYATGIPMGQTPKFSQSDACSKIKHNDQNINIQTVWNLYIICYLLFEICNLFMNKI
jgi:hypothetical protein